MPARRISLESNAFACIQHAAAQMTHSSVIMPLITSVQINNTIYLHTSKSTPIICQINKNLWVVDIVKKRRVEVVVARWGEGGGT